MFKVAGRSVDSRGPVSRSLKARRSIMTGKMHAGGQRHGRLPARGSVTGAAGHFQRHVTGVAVGHAGDEIDHAQKRRV